MVLSQVVYFFPKSFLFLNFCKIILIQNNDIIKDNLNLHLKMILVLILLRYDKFGETIKVHKCISSALALHCFPVVNSNVKGRKGWREDKGLFVCKTVQIK